MKLLKQARTKSLKTVFPLILVKIDLNFKGLSLSSKQLDKTIVEQKGQSKCSP